jgi:hypothetical protein
VAGRTTALTQQTFGHTPRALYAAQDSDYDSLTTDIHSGNKGCDAYFITEHKRRVHHLIHTVSRDRRKTWEGLHQNVEQDHDYGLEKVE